MVVLCKGEHWNSGEKIRKEEKERVYSLRLYEENLKIILDSIQIGNKVKVKCKDFINDWVAENSGYQEMLFYLKGNKVICEYPISTYNPGFTTEHTIDDFKKIINECITCKDAISIETKQGEKHINDKSYLIKMIEGEKQKFCFSNNCNMACKNCVLDMYVSKLIAAFNEHMEVIK